MSKQNFTHLHVHDEYSMLDGLDPTTAYPRRAKVLGQTHIASTNHGNICASPEFYRECRALGLNPILGCEFYFTEDAAAVKEQKKAGERFHVVFLARDLRGFEILTELSTESHRRFYRKPLIDRLLLEGMPKKDAKHLTVLSGCAGSVISKKITGEEEGDPYEEAQWWQKKFPNFYIELQHHDTAFDRKLNKGLVKVAKRLELPWVITNDPHYVLEEDCGNHDALLAIQTAADIDDPNRFRFEGEGYHLKSRKEMFQTFKEYGKEIWTPGAAATMEIAEATNIVVPEWETRTWHIPKFPGVKDTDKRLRKMAYKGLEKRGLADNQTYIDRVEMELAAYEGTKGMSDFLLIAEDVIRHINEEGGRTGPGRGSVCGTLVGYLVGLHKVDSIRYRLLFERFLNPERPKMPDVDIDMRPLDRPVAFQYTIEKYGEENVMHVAAYQTMKTKRCFQSLAGAYGMNFQKRNALSKKIEEDFEGNAILPEEVLTGYPDLVAQLERLTGIKGSMSSHPAGVLIFDPEDQVRSLVPLMWIPGAKGDTGKFVAQYNLKSTDFMYLLKQDFLGLRNMETIHKTVAFVKERHGIELDPDSWIPDEEKGDKAIYRSIGNGEVNGVFQMEGAANRQGIQQMGCKEFEDLVVCTSLFRAGPMNAGAPGRYMRNRQEQQVRVIHKSLKPILSETWGEMIYQEQMFRILNECAGFSWARVDDAKTAMAKKDAEMMAALEPEAMAGFQKTVGMTEDQARRTWEMIAAQSSYLFNRSHAVAYSLITYQTARLKHLYPLEYLCSIISTIDPKNDTDRFKRERAMAEMAQKGFRILPPCINKSGAHAQCEGDDAMRLGLQDIKGVGLAAATKIIKYREEKGKFEKQWQVKACTASNVNTNLRMAGAMECIGIKPDPSQQEELLSWQFYDPLADYRERLGSKLKMPKGDGGSCVLVGEIRGIEKRKTKNGNDFMKWRLRWMPGEEWAVTIWDSATSLWDLRVGSVVAVSGRWNQQYQNISIDSPEAVKVYNAVKSSSST